MFIICIISITLFFKMIFEFVVNCFRYWYYKFGKRCKYCNNNYICNTFIGHTVCEFVPERETCDYN